MSSSTIRGIRRKKSSLAEVKIVVLGTPSVGKSALVVRFLTKRFIGEYDHQSEQRYRNEVLVDNEPVFFEILDTCSKNSDNIMPSADILSWADGFMLVYDITDRRSFNWVKRVALHVWERKFSHSGCSSVSPTNLSPSGTNNGGEINHFNGLPIMLVANKADMVHLRQVSTEEGEILARDLDCSFNEVAASEHVTQVATCFHDLFREIQNFRKKNKTSLLDRVLGSKTKTYVRGKSDSALPKE